MAAEKVRLGPQNWRLELRIGPTCTARRDECVGENEDFWKMAERVQRLTRWQLPSTKSSAKLPSTRYWLYIILYYITLHFPNFRTFSQIFRTSGGQNRVLLKKPCILMGSMPHVHRFDRNPTPKINPWWNVMIYIPCWILYIWYRLRIMIHMMYY